MTMAELQDFAIQIVKDFGKINLLSIDNSLDAMPNIWFRNQNNEACWIIVRYCIFPTKDAVCDINLKRLPLEMEQHDGFFASIGFCPVNTYGNEIKMYRGEGAYSNFLGLKQIHIAKGTK